jgi:hypothetical protein
MDYDHILSSNAMFIKEYMEYQDIRLEDIPPQVTFFRIYTKEEKLLAHHNIPPLDLGDIEPELWSTLINESFHEQDLPNFMFFGICEIEGEDRLFLACYFIDLDIMEGRLFDLEIEDMCDFDVKDAFPNFDIIDFSKADISH